MRFLGLDYGSRYIGVAISDDQGRIAVPKDVWENTSHQEIQKKIAEVIHKEAIMSIIVGLPVRLDGKATAQTQATQKFIVWLQSIVKIPIATMDERLTTKLSTAYQKKNYKKQKRPDAHAAQIILQNYLDKQCPSSVL
ncbi:MAG: hypothetical protein A3B74_02470 [Candidatus Kerfeldbacteria bacterium RIFCSPHIGHO2_02_FULL_42_14]|uniref:Putative pre-16S rRNA nuclease n=1 Tax=Candidatus Kerfeldbacteria bacterium RIFCSPHIGHO2_02_FULL_42_14 TaxID=1798540 RepID=A0A1G2ASH0_9BACT|nr:MAG: hypothetical protein A3B74_02470 [Candidatus Kerfeldbacteria bacterium RIFCSPHIGHO2_02_FULL_42_14]OGY80479.1 MAG: hypothetical protein A3E60_05090 [Candidatus Kerfeldbacteria bacterium RIFCSPHIGHO2_12_FULL_42_13]OGY83838.1 MAG: hypothetical protein A3I91_04615 [Candidatus Kerfeldbacteria bacterium RIFCSPLOWO2_02_FULL_42_19]OGY85317.1 MAG: hypothetical protein A3G01_03340 [Candidatus Kerfeldbacteria bacterium RIFCSPLOWO2_12_FULL_43_9]